MEGESESVVPETIPESMPATMDVDEAVAAMEDDPDLPVQENHDSEDVPADEPPAFWNAEDKAAWADVPASLRPLLRKYEQQRVEFVNQKAREAAEIREQARA